MKLSENDYSTLLSIFNKVQENNNNKKAQGIHDYSLINALLKKTDEVNLHSNFIYSMINPKSSHYCGNKFLELFLKSINEINFINLGNARVHKEKGKIDLLIEDGEKVIIIENKLRAPDQPYQISRYVQYAIDTYLQGDHTSLDKKMRVIYLSEYKVIPSLNSESIIGFTLSLGKLRWNGSPIVMEITKKGIIKEKLNLDLPKDTELDFNRVQHSKELLKWVDISKSWLANKPNSDKLVYAFDEYKLILNRLDTKKPWRNIMSLDKYTFDMKDEKEQEQMYAFMCEANEKLNNFIVEKLNDTVSKLFPQEMRSELTRKGKTFQEFTKKNFLNWINKSGNKEKYRDVGFKIQIGDDIYVFALGVNNIAFGKLNGDINSWWDAKISREELQGNCENNLFTIINNLKSL